MTLDEPHAIIYLSTRRILDGNTWKNRNILCFFQTVFMTHLAFVTRIALSIPSVIPELAIPASVKASLHPELFNKSPIALM